MKAPNFRLRPPGPFHLAGILLGVVIIWASFYNLRNYPTIWWDEAIFSETAANLVQHGRYAFTVQSPEELSDLDYRISAGPMVILPVALAYRLLGVGVVSGRLVAGAYLVLAFWGLFLGARRLWGARPALGAVALALLGTDVLYWGRSVLGDIPALGLFLLGIWCLLRGLAEETSWPLFWGGFFLGLAFDAKEFYGLAFLPPLVVLARQSWGDKRRLLGRLLTYGVGVSLPILAYLLLKVAILGGFTAAVHHFLHQKALLRHEFFTPLTIGRIYPESWLFLLRNPLFWLGVFGVWSLRRQGPLSLGAQLWVFNFALWSLVYLTSVYWHRFALPALFLAAPLAAGFLKEMVVRLTAGRAPASRWPAAALVTMVLILFCPLPGVYSLAPILTLKDDGPYRLVNYINAAVPPGSLIETPEYELVFLDDCHRYHLMREHYFKESTPDKVVLLNPRSQPYDFNRVEADLLILGTFGKSVFRQVYPPSQISKEWQRIATVDFYDIYARRRPSPKTGKKTVTSWLKKQFVPAQGRYVPGTPGHSQPR